jgi:hypothetical protein
MLSTRTLIRLLAVALLAAVALPAQAETLEDLEKRALQDAVKKLTDPALAPLGERKRLQVALEKIPGFGWSEIDSGNRAGFEAKHFPRTCFIETICILTNEERSRATSAVDRTTGEARQIQRADIDGLLQDEAVFLALVREGRIALKEEGDVKAFVNWAQSIMESPRAIFGPCGNSKFGSKATKVDGGWKFVTTVDGMQNLAWKISCDADGIVTGVNRNLAGLPPGPTREQNRAARIAELKRREDAKAWWVEEGKKADLAALVAKSDLIGVATDFTSCSGTGRLYRVFTFHKGGLLFGDRLGNYSRDIYFASVQFPATMERRFEVESGDKWLVFLTARMDQGLHRDSTSHFTPAYDPAGEHAVVRCTDDLLANVEKLVAAKPTNPQRDAAIRKAAAAESVKAADSRTQILLARYAAKRVAEWSVEPMTAEPDAVGACERFRDIAFAYLRASGSSPGREALEADPAFQPLKDDPRWKKLLETVGK